MLLSCCVTLGKLLSLSVLQFYHQASLLMVESLPAVRETWVPSLGWEDPPGGGRGNPLQYSCLQNPHGQRSLASYSPWGHRVGQERATRHSMWHISCIHI